MAEFTGEGRACPRAPLAALRLLPQPLGPIRSQADHVDGAANSVGCLRSVFDEPNKSLLHPEGCLEGVVSKNTNELKTGSPERFGLEVSRLGSLMEARILGYEDAAPTLDLVIVCVFGHDGFPV